MLKKVKTLLVEGRNHGESRIEIADMDSTEKIKANNNGKNIETSSSAVVEAIPSDLKFFTIPLPRSLVRLSLANNNLSTESFPMDFSCLFMLKDLNLDYNPIDSLPGCLRSLPRIETLSLIACNMLTSVEEPPHTLTFLQIYIDSKKPMLRKIVYDRELCSFQLVTNNNLLASSMFEYEGLIKIQPMAAVEEKILRALCWMDLDFLIGRRLGVPRFDRREESEIQMYYEFGIFSTIYEGEGMPDWIINKITGPSMSFTIPSSPNNQFTGLNFGCVLTSSCLDERLGFENVMCLPMIIVINITKNLTWIYRHYIDKVFLGGDCLILLSHWMFGMNDMEAGDEVTVHVMDSLGDIGNAVTKECGVSLVYDDGEEVEDQEEDVLGCYKSWDCILGKDLTPCQLTSGEYYLNINQIMRSYD